MKKRVFDVLLASVLAAPALPVAACVAAGVALTLGRPVVFTQKRRGKDDELFTIYKFRSMTDARDADGNLLPDQQRKTRFGRFIRATGLDELPQLLNILKGDMSFVGPRPRSLSFANDIPDAYKDILSVKPGLTGPSQITMLRRGRVLPAQEKLKLDWDYAARPDSLRQDMKAIVQTLPVFVRGSGSDIGRKPTAQPWEVSPPF